MSGFEDTVGRRDFRHGLLQLGFRKRFFFVRSSQPRNGSIGEASIDRILRIRIHSGLSKSTSGFQLSGRRGAKDLDTNFVDFQLLLQLERFNWIFGLTYFRDRGEHFIGSTTQFGERNEDRSTAIVKVAASADEGGW